MNSLRGGMWVGVTCAVAMFASVDVYAQVAATVITPNGTSSTGTTVTSNIGADPTRFEVTTGTVSGGIGFNHLTVFDVKAGDRVDMIFPSSANTLVNLVRQKIRIDGLVQGIKDTTGRDILGGLLVFASPQGIDIGGTGTINSGSVILAAPTAKVIDDILGDFSKAQDLIAGNIDLAPGATINIDGTVNGAYGVSVFANNVVIDGDLRSGKFQGYADLGTGFPDIVKTAVNLNLLLGTNIEVLADGSIQITGNGGVVTDGDVDLMAKRIDFSIMDRVAVATSISVDGTIEGKNVTLTSDTSSGNILVFITLGGRLGPSSLYRADELGDKFVALGTNAQAVAPSLTAILPAAWTIQILPSISSGVLDPADFLGIPLGYLKAEAAAQVTIGGTASITAVTDVTILARTQTIIDDTAAVNLATLPFAAGFVYGTLDADANAMIDDGASVTAGGNFSLTAQNNSEVTISAQSISNASGGNIDAAVAVARANVDANAIVQSGATINAQNVDVLAYNDQSFIVTAMTQGEGLGAKVAGSLALADSNFSANAILGGDVGTATPTAVKKVLVEAISLTREHRVVAMNVTGTLQARDPLAQDPAQLLVRELFLSKLLNRKGLGGGSMSPGELAPEGGSANKLRVAGAVALTFSDQNAHAAIETYLGSGVAPTIVADAQVAVLSTVLNDNVRNSAESGVAASPGDADSGGDEAARISVSVGLAFADFGLDSTAEIGAGASVTAPLIGVRALNRSPFGVKYVDGTKTVGGFLSSLLEVDINNVLFSEEKAFIATLYSRMKDSLKQINLVTLPLLAKNPLRVNTPVALFTNYGMATSSATNFAFAASIGYFSLASNTTAWVDDNTNLVSTNASTGSWNIATQSGTSTFDDAITIDAETLVEGLFLAGDVNTLKIDGVDGSGGIAGGGGVAVGGSFNGLDVDTTTIAGIAAGADVSTNQSITISAETIDRIFALTPQGGEGAGTGISGQLALLDISGTTHASISNLAILNAKVINLTAFQGFSIWNTGGGVLIASNTSIGITGIVNLLNFDTSATIGDNDEDDPDDPNVVGINVNPGLTVTRLILRAENKGMASTLAVSGVTADDTEEGETESESGKTPTLGQRIGNIFGKKEVKDEGTAANTETTNSTNNVASNSSDLGSNSGAGDTAPGTERKEDAPKFGFALSGAVSLGLTDIDAISDIDGTAIVQGNGAATSSVVELMAINDIDLLSRAGAEALSERDSQSSAGAAAIGGALSYLISDNISSARIQGGSTLEGFNAVDVSALTGGLRIGAARGVGSTKTKGVASSTAIAGSVSIARIADSSRASIDSSTVSRFIGTPGTPVGAVKVIAYNTMTVGVAAGGESSGAKRSIGFAITYGKITDGEDDDGNSVGAADATISNSTVEDFEDLEVQANNAARLVGTASSIAKSSASGGFTLAGALVFNVVDTTSTASILLSTIDVGGKLVLVNGTAVLTALETQLARSGKQSLAAVAFAMDTNRLGLDPLDLFGTGSALPTGALIIGAAGAVSVNTGANSNSGGLSLVYNNISSSRTAVIAGSVVTAGTATSLDVDDKARIIGVAVGLGVSKGKLTGIGSVTINNIANVVAAEVKDSGATSSRINSGSASVMAENASGIFSFAGNVSINIGGKGNAVGAAVAVNRIAGRTAANMADATLTLVGTVTVDARMTGDIKSIAAAGSVASGGTALAGSATVNIITTSVAATLQRTSTTGFAAGLTGSPNVTVFAQRKARIQSLAGVLAAGKNGAGIGVAVNVIGGDVTAKTSGGSLTVNNLTTQAHALDTVRTISIGLGVGSSNAAVGSFVVNVFSTDVEAVLDGDVVIDARNNVFIDALSDMKVDAIAGALAIGGSNGIGLAGVVNVISGDTKARIDGASTSVIARALDAGEILTVRNDRRLGDNTLDTATKTVRGIAVNATSLRDIGVGAGAASVGGSNGGAINAIVNTVSGTTQASIISAKINQNVSGPSISDVAAVEVLAGQHIEGEGISLGAGVGGTVGAAGGAIVDVYNSKTFALVQNSNIDAVDLSIEARSSQVVDNDVFGLGGGGTGALAAGGVVTVFDATTRAQLVGGHIGADTALVSAESDNIVEAMAVIAAFGGTGAAAGSFVVVVNQSVTEGLIGRTPIGPTVVTDVDVNKLEVFANTNTKVGAIAISGSGGGGAAFAGMAAVIISQSQTRAMVSNADVDPYARIARNPDSVDIEATETFTVDGDTAGGAIGGGVGLGAGVQVVVVKSIVEAILQSSTVNTDDLDVIALSQTEIDLLTASLGAGGTVGASGAVNVIQLGGIIDGDASSSLDNTLGKTTQVASESNTINKQSDQTSEDTQESDYDVAGAVGQSASHRVSAKIIGSTIVAGSLDVDAKAETGTKSFVGAAAIGGTFSAGVAVGFTRVGTLVEAVVDANSSVSNASRISILALAANKTGQKAAKIEAFIGSLSGTVGLGAGVADAKVQTIVRAQAFGDLTGTGSGNLKVSAKNTSGVDLQVTGVAAGVVGAAGLVLLNGVQESTVTAELGHSVNNVLDFTKVEVLAESSGSAVAIGTGASAGIGVALQGTVVNTTDRSNVQARIKASSMITAGTGGLLVEAKAVPKASANTKSASIAGGAALGVTLATAKVDTTIIAEIQSNSVIMTSGAVEVLAKLMKASDNAFAQALGASGGLLVGAQASLAIVNTSANLTAQLGTGIDLTAASATVWSSKVTSQSAESLGVGLGFIAFGASNTDVISSGSSTARIGRGLIGMSGALEVRATTNELNVGKSTAGSGGIIAGGASDTDITSTTKTVAEYGTGDGAATGPFVTGIFKVNAVHTSNFHDEANSSQAAAAGFSGADTNVNLNNSATVTIGSPTDVEAGQIELDASVITIRTGGLRNVTGGAGGFANAASAGSSITVAQTSLVDIKSGARLRTARFLRSALSNDIIVDATTTASVAAETIQTTAGAFQAPKANIDGIFTSANTILVGTNVDLDSDGSIFIGARPNAAIDLRANAKTAAGISILSANSGIFYTVNQRVAIGDGANLIAEEEIGVATGRNGNGGLASQFDINATSNAYNSALIPASTKAGGTIFYLNNATLDIAANTNILAGWDVALAARNGEANLFAQGTATFNVAGISGTEREGSVIDLTTSVAKLNGVVLAGRLAERAVTIDSGGALEFFKQDPEDKVAVNVLSTIDPLAGLLARIAELKAIGTPAALSEVGVLETMVSLLRGNTGDSATQDMRGPGFDAVNGGTSSGQTGTAPTGGGAETGDPDPNTPAIEIADMTARSGSVDIYGKIVNIGDSVTSTGGPSITIVNHSSKALVLHDILLQNFSDGRTRINPAAVVTGLSNVHEIRPGQPGEIIIDNSPSTGTSDLFALGVIENLSGLVQIDVTNGNLVQSGRISASRLQITVPNGGYFAFVPKGIVNLGPDPRVIFEQYIAIKNWQNRTLIGAGNAGSRASIPVLFGTNINRLVSTLGGDLGATLFPNLRTPNEFATFAMNFLAQPTSGLSFPLAPAAPGENPLSLAAAIGAAYTQNLQQGIPTSTALGSVGAGSNAIVFREIGNIGGCSVFLLFTACTTVNDVRLTNSVLNTIPSHDLITNFFTASRSDVENTLTAAGSINLVTPSGEILIGGVIGVTAKFIDIAGKIRSGQVTTRSVIIDAAVNTAIAADTSGAKQIDVTKAATLVGFSDKETNIVVWDVDAQQLVVKRINATGGGNVILHGQIINSSGLGEIEILNGFGDVDITNTTGRDLVVDTIDTGTSGVGMLQITDTAKPSLGSHGVPNTFWYVHQPGGNIQVFNNSNGAVKLVNAVSLPDIVGNSTTILPKDHIRFTYWEEQKLVRNYSQVGATFFTDPTVLVSAYQWDSAAPRVGFGVDTGQTTDGNYFEQKLSAAPVLFTRLSVVDGDTKALLRRLDIVEEILFRRDQSVLADGAIGLKFTGNPVGTVDVISNSEITFIGAINNPTGTITVNTTSATAGQGSLSQEGTGQLIGTDLSLTANGAIGAKDAEIRAFILANGSVFAQAAGGSVNLEIGAADKINLVQASSNIGDVVILADSNQLLISNVSALLGNVRIENFGDITGTAVSLVTGNDIELVSLAGEVGTASQAFRINSGVGQPTKDAVATSVIITALNDINVIETDGTLRLERVSSTNGAVKLATLSGDIANIFAPGIVDPEQIKRINEAIDSLKLLTDDGFDNIQAFRNLVAINYGLYWDIKENATVNGAGIVSLSTNQAKLFALRFAAADGGLIIPDISDAAALGLFVDNLATTRRGDITNYVQGRFNGAKNFLEVDLPLRLVNAGDLDAAIFTTPLSAALVGNRNPVFAVLNDISTTGIATQLKLGLDWSQQDLRAAVSAAAARALGLAGSGNPLITTPSTQVFQGVTAVTAATTVTLIANMNVGGSFAPEVIPVDFSDPKKDPNLTLFQRALLATASPGDLTVSISGQITTFTVSPANPVFVAAGAVLASGGGDVFIGSNGVLNVEALTATGDIRALGRDGVLAAASASPVNPFVVGTNLLIESELGAVGASARPILVSLSGGLTRAGSATGIFLVKITGDFKIGNVFSLGAIDLTAAGGAILALFDEPSFALTELHIQGDTIDLSASTGIGQPTRPLGIQVDGTHLNASTTTGGIWLKSPSASDDLPLGALTAETFIRVAAQSSILASSSGQTNITTTDPAAFVDLHAVNSIGAAILPIILDTPTATAVADTGSIYLHFLSDVHTPLLSAVNGTVSVLADGNFSFDVIRSFNLILDVHGPLTGTFISTEVGSLKSDTLIDITTIEVGSSLDLESPFITAGIVQKLGRTNPLVLTATGLGGAPATFIDLSVGTSNPVIFTRLSLADGTLTTTSSDLNIVDGTVINTLLIQTSALSLLINNNNPAPQSVDVQLFGLVPDFFLTLKGTNLLTDMFIVFVRPGTLATFSSATDLLNGFNVQNIGNLTSAIFAGIVILENDNGDPVALVVNGQIVALLFGVFDPTSGAPLSVNTGDGQTCTLLAGGTIACQVEQISSIAP